MNANTKSRIAIGISIVAVIISAMGVCLSHQSLKVEIQSLSLEISSHVPNKPELDIYPREDYFGHLPTLSVQQVLGETTAGDGQKVTLRIRNIGGIDTGHMTFEVVSPTYLKSTIVNYPEGVKSGGHASVDIYIKPNRDKYNNSLQPGDIVPVIFKITCTNCERQKRNFNEPFNFSITV